MLTIGTGGSFCKESNMHCFSDSKVGEDQLQKQEVIIMKLASVLKVQGHTPSHLKNTPNTTILYVCCYNHVPG